MASEEPNKFSSNLKVPPLKIVLSSHQNNAVINMGTVDEDQFKSNVKGATSDDQIEHKDIGRRNSFEHDADSSDNHHKRQPNKGSDRTDLESTGNKTGFSCSSSSSSSASDRSTSTTPSSELESLASNSTIISEPNQVKSKADQSKDDLSSNNKTQRVGVKISTGSGASLTPGKKAHQESSVDQTNTESTTTASSKEQNLNANQRITRSSQRAAQQNRSEIPSESNGDESIVSENQDKGLESARKVKRRKGEPQEADQDNGQASAQPAIVMANFYPADYQLPPQNSFELYRDIRKRPYKKLMKLNNIQPRVPRGFKDFLMNGGPYLLDGNKLGVGLSGARSNCLNKSDIQCRNGSSSTNRMPLRMKLPNLHKKLSSTQQLSQQRHSSYNIPKILEAPKSLQLNLPLYELFQDQEKARHQMRMQHLKERERSILSAEQEILRAYNKVAIANVRQKLHLSACTYFYYQERYHYQDEKSGSNGNVNSKEVPHSQDNSFLCIEGGESTKSLDGAPDMVSSGDPNISAAKETSGDASSEAKDASFVETNNDGSTDSGQPIKTERIYNESSGETEGDVEMKTQPEELNKIKPAVEEIGVNGTKLSDSTNASCQNDTDVTLQPKDNKGTTAPRDNTREDGTKSAKAGDQTKNADIDSDNSVEDSSNGKEEPTRGMTDEDLKEYNKNVFLNQLQEIDDKWDQIKRDMMVRHRNESDSLHAVQTLDWEWKAKEIGACDVRVSLKIEPEFVPRVDVSALDY